jgi:hypothetical protein
MYPDRQAFYAKGAVCKGVLNLTPGPSPVGEGGLLFETLFY